MQEQQQWQLVPYPVPYPVQFFGFGMKAHALAIAESDKHQPVFPLTDDDKVEMVASGGTVDGILDGARIGDNLAITRERCTTPGGPDVFCFYMRGEDREVSDRLMFRAYPRIRQLAEAALLPEDDN